MIGIRVHIVRCVDESVWPPIVAIEFVDAHRQTHQFAEKSAIVTADDIDATTLFPHPAVIACQILRRQIGDDGLEVVTVDTENPWHVESLDAKTQFDVFPGQLVEWEFGSSLERPWTSNA